MIHRALVYLMLTRLKNGILDIRRKPSKLIATLLLLGIFAMMVASRSGIGGDSEVARLQVLISILALYLLLSLFGGLGEPGPIFRPEDVDFVFPAPFRRRHVLVYHLMRHYLQMVLLGLMYAVFFGVADLPNPLLGFLGIYLCLVVCSQLQTAMMLLAASVSDHVFGRLRFAARAALFGSLAIAVLFAVAGAAGIGDVAGMLSKILSYDVAHVLFYPAIAVGQLAFARDAAAAIWPLLGLLFCVAGSFVIVLLFPVNFIETATTRAERKRRTDGGNGRSVRSVGSAHPMFSGAGSVAWLNALTLRRRLRIIVGALIMLLVMLMFAGTRGGRGGAGVPYIMVLLVFYPLIVQIPLGFKGHREHLEQFKTLPLSALKLAWGEVVFPALVLWILQIVIVGVFVAAGRLEPFWLAAGALVYPVVDVGVVALSDVFQLGRDRRSLSFLHVTGQMMAMAASLMPAVFAAVFTLELTGDPYDACAAAVLVHGFVDLILLRILARRFKKWEPGE